MNQKDGIFVTDATQNNLRHVSVAIPKGAITVVTGVSGSGKSSLVLDTVAAQSRRELNDTFPSVAQRYLPKYRRPHVGSIEHLPTAIVIDQKQPGSNVRSTLGTYTDIYSQLRLLSSRVGEPFVGYSDCFSFNHPQGRCPRCDGLGEVTEIDVHKLVDFDKCLNDPGVIRYVAFEPGLWRWLYYGACGLYDPNKKIRDFTPEKLHLFLWQEPMKLKNPPLEYYKAGTYEGLMYRMNRMLQRDDAKVHWKKLEPPVTKGPCPVCGGRRLNQKILSCKIGGKNISEVTSMPLGEILDWLNAIHHPLAVDIQASLRDRIGALIDIGLDYLTLDWPIGTLSGGELQQMKLASHLGDKGQIFILDEPTNGLQLPKCAVKPLPLKWEAYFQKNLRIFLGGISSARF